MKKEGKRLTEDKKGTLFMSEQGKVRNLMGSIGSSRILFPCSKAVRPGQKAVRQAPCQEPIGPEETRRHGH